MRKRFRYSDTQSPKESRQLEAVGDSEAFGRDMLYTVLKQKYSGFSKDVIQVYLNSCSECQLQKCKNELKSTVTKPIRTSEFASRSQVDLIDLQITHEVNRPYNFLMIYQDHLTKFVVLCSLQRKSDDEVVNHLLDTFSFA